MNNWNAVGRLTRDPEFITKEGEKKGIKFSLALNDNEGKPDYVPIEYYGNAAVALGEKVLLKGFLVGLSGQIRSSSYEGKDGKKVYVVKCVAEKIMVLQWPAKVPAADPGQDRTD